MSLRKYEIILVADANMTDDESKEVFEKFKTIVLQGGGAVKFESRWGRRRLAYEVRKIKYGIYHLLFAEANGSIVEEMERQAGYDDRLVKYFVLSVSDLEAAYNDFEALKTNPQKNATLVSEALGA